MIHRAALAAGAILAAAIASSCARSSPALHPESRRPAGSFVADLEGRARGADGSLRFRGVVAVGEGDRLRAEISGAAPGSPLILVSSGGETTAIVLSERVFYRGSSETPLLPGVTGGALRPGAIARALGGGIPAAEGPCTLELGSWRESPSGGAYPSRLRCRCPGGSVVLGLSGARPIPEGADPFEPPPIPEGWTAIGAERLEEILLSRGPAR